MVVVWTVVLFVAAVVGFSARQSASGSPPSISVPAPSGQTYSAAPSRGSTMDSATRAIQQCTSAVRANPQWVCLSKAVRSGSQLTLTYTSNFTPTASPSGHHIHIFTAQLNTAGTITPADSTMGMQATPSSAQGSWWTDYQASSIAIDLSRRADSQPHRPINTKNQFVCVRAATQQHGLVPDLHGGYRTGNCMRIAG
jgi:hypothetical protein